MRSDGYTKFLTLPPLAVSRLDDRRSLGVGDGARLERALDLVFPLVDPARRRDDQFRGAFPADSLNELASLDANEAGQRLGERARYHREKDTLKSVTVRSQRRILVVPEGTQHSPLRKEG